MFYVKESQTTQASSLIDSLDVLALDMANSSQTNVTEMKNVGRYSLNIEYAPLKLSAYPADLFFFFFFWKSSNSRLTGTELVTCAFSSIFDKTQFSGFKITSRTTSVNYYSSTFYLVTISLFTKVYKRAAFHRPKVDNNMTVLIYPCSNDCDISG